MTATSDRPEAAVAAAEILAEVDLDAIGHHCDLKTCHRLDFLAFECLSCMQKFCLDHRTEAAHNCAKPGEWGRRRADANGAVLRKSTGATGGGGKTSNCDAASEKIKKAEEELKLCAETKCKTALDTGLHVSVECEGCNRRYCLAHRWRNSHDCENLPQIGARASSASSAALNPVRQNAMAALTKFKAWTNAKNASISSISSSSSSSSPASFASSFFSGSRKLAVPSSTQPKLLAELKRVAKAAGGTVPPEQRVYLFVEATVSEATTPFSSLTSSACTSSLPTAIATTTTTTTTTTTIATKSSHPSGKLYFAKLWTIGRLLDAAASSLHVENLNNRGGGEEQKLRVYHVDGGRVLDFKEKVGDVLVNGNTVVLMRGIGGDT